MQQEEETSSSIGWQHLWEPDERQLMSRQRANTHSSSERLHNIDNESKIQGLNARLACQTIRVGLGRSLEVDFNVTPMLGLLWRACRTGNTRSNGGGDWEVCLETVWQIKLAQHSVTMYHNSALWITD